MDYFLGCGWIYLEDVINIQIPLQYLRSWYIFIEMIETKQLMFHPTKVRDNNDQQITFTVWKPHKELFNKVANKLFPLEFYPSRELKTVGRFMSLSYSYYNLIGSWPGYKTVSHSICLRRDRQGNPGSSR